MVRKLIVIGSGCAGYTAAIYAARADLKPLVLAGQQFGGQLVLTSEVENFPGFPEGILGPELMERMRKQAERFGTEIIFTEATGVDLQTRPFKVVTNDRSYQAQSIIIATGASARWLGLESEARLRGRGVSSCATCDAPLFRGKEVIVVGGGDAAVEEAIFCSKFTKKVTVVHRRDRLRASKIMQDRAFRNEKISFIWDTTVKDILGEGVVEGVLLQNVKTGEVKKLACQGAFIAIGHDPNTGIFKGQVELDEKGYIIVRDGTKTSVEGAFAAGDVVDYRYRQAVTAAGMGCMAALDVEKYLQSLEG